MIQTYAGSKHSKLEDFLELQDIVGACILHHPTNITHKTIVGLVILDLFVIPYIGFNVKLQLHKTGQVGHAIRLKCRP